METITNTHVTCHYTMDNGTHDLSIVQRAAATTINDLVIYNPPDEHKVFHHINPNKCDQYLIKQHNSLVWRDIMLQYAISCRYDPNHANCHDRETTDQIITDIICHIIQTDMKVPNSLYKSKPTIQEYDDARSDEEDTTVTFSQHIEVKASDNQYPLWTLRCQRFVTSGDPYFGPNGSERQIHVTVLKHKDYPLCIRVHSSQHVWHQYGIRRKKKRKHGSVYPLSINLVDFDTYSLVPEMNKACSWTFDTNITPKQAILHLTGWISKEIHIAWRNFGIIHYEKNIIHIILEYVMITPIEVLSTELNNDELAYIKTTYKSLSNQFLDEQCVRCSLAVEVLNQKDIKNYLVRHTHLHV